MTKSNSVKRIYWVVALIVASALFLGARLYFVQVVHGDDFSERADRQYVRPSSNVYDRGSIFFQDKTGSRISAATLKSGYMVAINPDLITNPESVYEQLSRVVHVDKDEFIERARKPDDPHEEVAHHIPEEKAESVKELQIDGVGVFKEKWRYYPGEDLASPVLGFVAYKEDERAGRYGIERFYEPVLKRSNDDIYVNFFAQVFSSIKDVMVVEKGKREGDVVLTIEPTVQSFLEETLTKTRDQWGSERTMGIIMDPESGDIYAMGVAPDFNLNQFGAVDNIGLYKNQLVENVYEMGSIFKPITMAAGIDAGEITAKTTYDDTGSITLNGSTISNYDGEARGVVDMQEVLNQSLNTGAAFVAEELGHEKFRNYLYRFGVNQKTGIDLPNEAAPLVKNLNSPRDIEYVTASFGQGIALSPIGMTRSLAALANGGKLVTPHVADSIQYEFGFSNELKKEAVDNDERVVSKETSEEITRMLVKVVDEALKDGEVKLNRHSVAAKTGTAQVAKQHTSGYYENIYNHSFFGYFPAYDPQFLVFLMNVKPKGAKYASETLTSPFMDLTKFLINYYEIPPDR